MSTKTFASVISDELQELAKYTPVGFDYKLEESNTQPGFIVVDEFSKRRFLVTVIEV